MATGAAATALAAFLGALFLIAFDFPALLIPLAFPAFFGAALAINLLWLMNAA